MIRSRTVIRTWIVGSLVCAWLGVGIAPAHAVTCGATSQGIWNDFNGDGSDDLAVGVPYESVGSDGGAGSVNVLYGPGPTATGDQLWNEDSPGIVSTSDPNDHFGNALAAGDFNGDGCGDLAVGVYGKDVAGVSSAGGVHVIYGSSLGLTSDGDRLWTQDSPGMLGGLGDADFFGWALTVGRFNGDAYTDLAITDLYEATNGAVAVMYGSSTGLTAAGNQLWSQDSPGIIGHDFECQTEFFGSSTAAGDLDGDGIDDLAAGVPGEDFGGTGCGTAGYLEEGGGVNVIYGTAGGLSSTGNQFWSQDSSGVKESVQADDRFGEELAAGDFDGNGRGDLAVGTPDETVSGQGQAGVAQILYGTASGLASAGNQLWSESTTGIPGVAQIGDSFGWALVTGNFGKGPEGDLAIGTPFQTINGQDDAGWVHVLYGSAGTGLTASNDDVWSQDSPGVLDTAETGDALGTELGDARFTAGVNSLLIGVPAEDVGAIGGAGAVNVLRSSAAGLSATNDQLWSQGSPGVLEIPEVNDGFGSALVAG